MFRHFVTALAALCAGSILHASANTHPYTLPSYLPASPSAPAVRPNTEHERVRPKMVLSEPHDLLKFEAKLDGIYMNDAPFTFKGANYFGFETDILVPHGLWGGDQSTTIQDVATMLKANNFNAVRLPLAVDAVLQNPVLNKYLVQNEVEFFNKFESTQMTYFDLMDYVIDVFAQNNLLVMLDAHRLEAKGEITELWYTSDANKDNFESAWRILANRYHDTWNVVAADLKNEPHGAASWGSNDPATDWRLAALKWATNIQEITPRWLIFVEGMQYSSRDVPEFGAFWGENLMDVERAQLELPVPGRLVYSPHTYGPDVYVQNYFLNETFPANMPAIWDLHFGFVHNKYGPLVPGEWGGKYRTEADKTWQNAFAAYLKEKGLGWFYWCINPNSGDTEGLLENDWKTPRADKLAMLSIFEGTPIP